MLKKKILPVIAIFAVMAFVACGPSSKSNQNETDGAHNSQNALDWAGVYQGILPCADCEGIQTTLEIDEDNGYRIQTKYLGTKEKEKDTFTESGKFSWNDESQIITLENGNKYFVGENYLNQLDRDGNEITGELADHYTLKKQNGQLTETYWKLTELEGEEVVMDSTFNREPHIVLRDEDNRVSGNGGCNQLMGTYELEGDNKISFSKMASTMMACPDLELEQKFAQMFENVDHYSLNGEKLELLDGDKVLARFAAVYFH